MITVTQGNSSLTLQFDDHQRVLSAHSLSEDPVVAWLCHWLPGRDLRAAQEEAAEELLTSKPHYGLMEARLIDALLKDALYLTHRKVEVSGVIVCRCRQVTRESIREAIAQNPEQSREDLTLSCKAGSGCGSCISDLEKLLMDARPKNKRWHDKPNSHWVLLLQESLERWQQRNAGYPDLSVKGFQEGVVRVHVEGSLSADQEWDLINSLSDYWAEGFPAALSLFLDFSLRSASSLAQTAKISSER